jgi:hypothetical protein
MNTVTLNNNILEDDNLINLIKSNFNKDDLINKKIFDFYSLNLKIGNL